jgi:hypothetical protein
LAIVLLAPLVAAGDEPAGETPAANKQPPEQTVTSKPPPESAPAFEGISIEPFVPSEKVTADTAVAFPVDI